jgi:hypothetical protein
LPVYHLDPESFLLAAHRVDRRELTALDTLQHRLTRDPEYVHRFSHWQETIAGFAVEPRHQLIGQADASWSARCQLFARDDAIVQQAMNGRRSNAEHDRSLSNA